jgi:predicted metal-dependent peptidase
MENKRYTEIKTGMLLEMPFFSQLLFDLMTVHVGKFPDIFPQGNETAATDGRSVWIDEDFLASLTVSEGIGLVCHEVGHAMWQHMPRMKYYMDSGFEGQPFSAEVGNIAGDYIINAMLTESGVKLPKCGLLDPKYTSAMSLEEVYRDLMQQQQKQGGQGRGGNGQGKPGSQLAKGQQQGTMDKHIPSLSNQVTEAEMKRCIKSAAEAAKAMGKLPAGLERFVDNYVSPKVTWKEALRNVASNCLARDCKTWNKPHRRRLVRQRVYLPSMTGYGAGSLVVVVDTSGSIGETELRQALSECDAIIDTAFPDEVYLLGADAAVASVHHFNGGERLADNPPTVKGGGGTDFRPAFEWVRENGIKPDTLIYITDMYGTFPDAKPDYPVIWCKTTDVEAPWGIQIKMEEA